MEQFPFSVFVYIFSGIMCIIYGIRYLRVFHKTDNIYFKNFFYLGMWVGAGLFLYGVPAAFPNYNSFPRLIRALGWLISSFLLFMGINEALNISLISWGKEKIAAIIKFLLPLATGLLVLSNLLNTPNPQVDKYGLIHWNVPYPFNIIWFSGGILITLIPAIFLFWAKTENKKTIIKKAFFSITFFFGGIGGWSNIIIENTIGIAASYAVFLLGSISLGIVILIDIFMTEEKIVE